jgi:transposase-like protein
MRGKKGEKHSHPADPPRRRANKQKGHGTYANDRPPIGGSVGRESGQVRLRMVKHTDAKTLERHIAQFTQPAALVNTDEWQGYNHIARAHVRVHHGTHEWARDEDGDGLCEVHSNTAEGLWTSVRNFLRPFRGVHKDHLAEYVAMCEQRINQKRITPAFIATLVHCT